MINIEARNLDIEWDTQRHVLRVNKSPDALEIAERDGVLTVETITYSKAFFYVGFRLISGDLLHTPYFSLGARTEDLLRVHDPISDETWWIESGNWDAQKKKYLHASYRTAGTLCLNIQRKELIVLNHTNNFSVDDLEYFLSDFKNDLWSIILDERSMVGADIERRIPNIFSGEILNQVDKFIEAADKLLESPKFSLRETQNRLPRARTRPVPRTFRELATKPDTRFLTSRMHYPSFDTSENRYVHYCIERLNLVTQRTSEIATTMSTRLEEKITELNQEIQALSSPRLKKVSNVLFDKESQAILQKLEQIKTAEQHVAWLATKNGSNNDDWQEYTFSLDKHFGKEGSNSFFCNNLNGKPFRDYSEYKERYLVIEYPQEIFDILEPFSKKEHFSLRISIAVTGIFEWYADETKKCLFKCKKVKSIFFKEPNFLETLEKRKVRRAEYVANNWETPYSYKEKQEIKQETQSLRNRAKSLLSLSRQYRDAGDGTKSRQRKLRDLRLAFASLGVGSDSHFPNSMVFFQNPDYGAVYRLFGSILRHNNLDQSQLEQIITMDRVGVIAVSGLYERWVLLQIIKILTDEFDFRMEVGWQGKLISAVLNKGRDICFSLESENLQLAFKLFYEKTLPNNKRPDFVLDILYRTYDFQDDHGWTHNSKWETKRLVMDAKFYDRHSDEYLNDTVTELTEEKNYSEDGANRVFVIHPTPEPISAENVSSPLVWARCCNYGHEAPIYHARGYVFLVPSRRHRRSVDNLKRLLLLHLQSATTVLEDKQDKIGGVDKPYWQNYLCPGCGAGYMSLDVTGRRTKSRSTSWTIACKRCQHVFQESFCYACHTRIFKNGFHWTYHKTYAEQITNCLCPHCSADLNDLQY